MIKIRKSLGPPLISVKKMALCHPDKPFYAKDLCRSCYEKELRSLNPDYAQRQQGNSRQWAEKFIDKKRKADKNWLAKQDKNYRRGVAMKSRFGISLDDYHNLFINQNGRCAICQQASKRNLHIDHCHTTGKIRGLLCFRCNWGLSFFKDGQLISNAYQYILKSKELNDVPENKPLSPPC